MNQVSKIEKVKLFRSIFKGREDVFAIYWQKGKKKGYMPAYQYDPYMYRLHAYKAIIIEAEKFSHELNLHFGVLSSRCQDESEYIERSRKVAKNILVLDDYEIENLFFGNFPPRKQLKISLKKIIRNIEELNSIPINKQHYDF